MTNQILQQGQLCFHFPRITYSDTWANKTHRHYHRHMLGFPSGSDGKESAYSAGYQVWSLGSEDSLKKDMATHSSILAWRIPWTEESGRLKSVGLQSVRHNWETNTFILYIDAWDVHSDSHWKTHTRQLITLRCKDPGAEATRAGPTCTRLPWHHHPCSELLALQFGLSSFGLKPSAMLHRAGQGRATQSKATDGSSVSLSPRGSSLSVGWLRPCHTWVTSA